MKKNLIESLHFYAPLPNGQLVIRKLCGNLFVVGQRKAGWQPNVQVVKGKPDGNITVSWLHKSLMALFWSAGQEKPNGNLTVTFGD